MLDYVDPNTGEVTRFSSNQDWLLLILQEGGTFRMRELRGRTGFNKKTIGRYLDELSKEHNIRVTEYFSKTSYTLVD